VLDFRQESLTLECYFIYEGSRNTYITSAGISSIFRNLGAIFLFSDLLASILVNFSGSWSLGRPAEREKRPGSTVWVVLRFADLLREPECVIISDVYR
jgi:hypothetical protein